MSQEGSAVHDGGRDLRHHARFVVEPTTLETASARPVPSAACVVGVEGVRGTHELEPGVPLSIGRSHSSGIQVDDAAVSRLHATLEWDGRAQVVVTDHGSRNGTFVAGQRVQGTRSVPSGASIAIGPARLVLIVPPPESPPTRTGAMGAALALADRAAQCDLSVLLLGETGTGKEVLAQRIHRRSRRAGSPFVPVNCGTIPEALAEAVLFGHERGSFTGASAQKAGLFEAAQGGTLFLDEIGELSLASQARLLRALEQREIVRVGATTPMSVDVRVIAATHRDLDREGTAGRFRRDLLYRLDVLRIAIPPLRERMDELPSLVTELLAELGQPLTVEPAALERLTAHDFPGNVRELRNVLARALATSNGIEKGVIDVLAIEGAMPEGRPGPPVGALRGHVGQAERDAIVAALEATGGNQTHAAKRLGISRRALLYKMQRHGLGRDRGER